MEKNRYLTKSIFKLATECPTKLFYTGKKDKYANQKPKNSFLLALADGGNQVGELAKHYFPGGEEIKIQDHDKALEQTNELLGLDQVTIFEAAIATDKLFIRADILVKDKNRLSLYEVKAKSIDPKEKNKFLQSKQNRPYLYDVAFQKIVIERAYPQYEVSVNLMLVDKSAKCPTDGLNQKFQLVKDSNNRVSVSVSETLTEEDLISPILRKMNVDAEYKNIYSDTYDGGEQSLNVEQWVDWLADHYVPDSPISTPISTACAKCEFRTTEDEERIGLESGFKRCWKDQLGWNDQDFECPTVLDVWQAIGRGKDERDKNQLIQDGIIKMSQLSKADIIPKPEKNIGPGLSQKERQWLQVEKVQNGDYSIWLDRESLRREMYSWDFPLHFIDFETASVAIPFYAGRGPYEGIAFQFSHHVVSEDGSVEHFGQFLNKERGTFPNFEFVRALNAQLKDDNGTIFQYARHEYNTLNMIYRQFQDEKGQIADRDELCEFIKSITHKDERKGKRTMVDLWEIVKRYYYDPATKGSNSIKDVLPAILNSSTFLQNKYSKPIYGSKDGIRSKNFETKFGSSIRTGK